ncbi:MAG TPA: alanine racemase [Microbacterium sp.]|uniref:alanine racemase n=1 Tax=Microbacterium sp. TaxID=51671 RepID=UPI002BE48F1D|nr:alanine racemase [Microbacterium sp.]HWI31228.1 alanine racemase [Microbacterium sp.]
MSTTYANTAQDAAAATRRERRAARPVGEVRRIAASTLLSSPDARAAIALHGTPLLLLEPDRVRAQYRRLHEALPFVRFHYAVKALCHDAVLATLADEGSGFGVATMEELTAVTALGISARRIIHTHPIKKPAEIADAIRAGVRTFVVDNATELAKFAGLAPDIGLLVRLRHRSSHGQNDAPHGQHDASHGQSDRRSEFGVGPFEAAHLIEQALAQGTRIAGFSFHLGSQLNDLGRFGDAIADTLTLMDHLQGSYPVRFDTLDIGGGFPIAYDKAVAPIEAVADVIRPLLEPRRRELDIIAEPGRVLVAEAMTAVTSVVGVAERADGRWYYLDDGVGGAYSLVARDDVHPLVFAERELARREPYAGTHRWATLAGPSGDPADIIAREALLPDLVPGDRVVSPAMGGYTVATSASSHGRSATRVAVMGTAPDSGSMAAVIAPQTVPYSLSPASPSPGTM